jgi:hypothetical protein
LLNRLEYGKILIDVVTNTIGELTPGHSIGELQISLAETPKKDILELTDASEHPKLKAIMAALNKTEGKPNDYLSPSLVETAIKAGNEPEKEFASLLKECLSHSDMSQSSL